MNIQQDQDRDRDQDQDPDTSASKGGNIVWTKESFEAKAECSVSSEFWQDHGRSIQSSNGQDALWDVLKAAAKSDAKAAMSDAKAAKALEEVERLNRQLASQTSSPQKQKEVLVLSSSTAAKNKTTRSEFRRLAVAEEPCRGGFVAQKFYLDFVFAARELINSTRTSTGTITSTIDENEKKKKQDIVGQVRGLGRLLFDRVDNSLFGHSYGDAEEPQSAIASELFRLALCLLNPDEATKAAGLKVTHQQALVAAVEEKDVTLIRFKTKPETEIETETETASPSKKSRRENGQTKIHDKIDICIWFQHPEETLGACVLATCEYKPSNAQSDLRQTQADMTGSNIIVLHKKQCIVLDIAGSSDVDSWLVSAHGLVETQFSKSPSPSWEKTLLYEGRGAEAIVSVARGLLAARDSFPRSLEDYGSRLGPSVGVVQEEEHVPGPGLGPKLKSYVYKVFDGAETRQPNIAVVKEFFDADAELFTTTGGEGEGTKKMQILKMKLVESDWKGEVSSKVFELIIDKLGKLHKKYGPHADIRLANLLSSGDIIDFDFVGLKVYPSTIQSITQDGKRHNDVETMIETIANNPPHATLIEPRMEHDWYSLGQVMRLFAPTEDSNEDEWVTICQSVEEGDETNIPRSIREFPIKLQNSSIPIVGTKRNHTPRKEIRATMMTLFSRQW
eukprot:CAMPEP_0113461794 /NCGR_PEP_ID=MMETSP0014_2-20120614/11733_1 /TAXON_ID=2857 /ORGANISM="Nitzschia sp." /LENGTH=674 /DNA_ID=CAMNT_0000353583 /DNA_START=155 /DNA_END=2176 /DNA_ORIENTATION=- /assembly_acc=CAM_ASM_000159